jgi:hypothetical protein
MIEWFWMKFEYVRVILDEIWVCRVILDEIWVFRVILDEIWVC